ncbi:MAG: hypothetical protein ACOC87_04080 [Candidatus Natronoplasma sp.]
MTSRMIPLLLVLILIFSAIIPIVNAVEKDVTDGIDTTTSFKNHTRTQITFVMGLALAVYLMVDSGMIN